MKRLPEMGKRLFPMYKEHYCENFECAERQLMSRRTSLALKALMVSRVLFLCLAAGIIGGTAHSFIFGQPYESIARAALSERVTKSEVQIQMQSAEIALLRQTVAQQDKDISEMHGIGLGLGCILLVLQVIQMVAGRLIGLNTRKE